MPALPAPSPRAFGVLAGALVLALLGAGCTSEEPSAKGPEPPPATGTPLADVATGRLAVARQPFCDGLDPAAVERALDGPVRAQRTYASGERTKVTDDLTEVVHEHGCVFHGPAGASARAWVFAPPVTRGFAADLVTAARTRKGCGVNPTAPAFGRPSLALLCRDDREVAASWRGLFGDAWLVCEVIARGGDDEVVVDRGSRWCVEVVRAAGS